MLFVNWPDIVVLVGRSFNVASSQEILNQLVENPAESLNVEVKRWLDPKADEGKAKIAIACMALRNRNGGRLIIGFDDKALHPSTDGRPADLHQAFNTDSINSIVSYFASHAFEVEVGFGERVEGRFPVLSVAPGVRAPVAAKRPLIVDGKHLIRQDAVYFRTLNSSNVPSSSIAKHSDWPDIVEICFENREADFGRFLRRHLGPNQLEMLIELITGLKSGAAVDEGVDFFRWDANSRSNILRSRTFELLRMNDRRRRQCFDSDEFRERAQQVEKAGTWSAMLVIDPPFPDQDSSQKFFDTVANSNPQYTGWPVWLDSRNFHDEEFRPRKTDKGWDTIVLRPGRTWGAHADFYRIKATGEFYLWRVLGDDMSEHVEPSTVLDPGLMIYRVAETIAVGLAIAKGLERGEGTSLAFAFRWEKLQGRQIQSWTDPRRYYSPHGQAYDDQAEGFVVIDAGTSPSAIAPFVQQATEELFAVWAMEHPLNGIEQVVRRVLERSA
ncbi:helix-turn-helix domain-containing protein [Mesorhizobium sp. ESP-6-2]|uniref:AlbA family DNA-binding domain-containing protein n=1 Tax=Mesorhizobium sp. ESP-6-2 TaxID=2876625 RepID=UPI001CCDC963|nr:ATP-binding protein [Mesorhizobium sp. ESP-6-2]MBZ9808105.1 ATP-binding protein [Mesorhizobium sp. ESP-6-2]